MIRVDAVWLAVEPLDMRAGTDTALGRIVKVFGAAHPHHAYLFANLLVKVFQCPTAFDADEQGRIKAEFE